MNYEQCLRRGLLTAAKSFPGYRFEIHDHVRTQTMEWVSQNCDKLFYTPQLHPSNMSLLRKVAEDARRVARDAFALFKYRVSLLRHRYRGTKVTTYDMITTANRNRDVRAKPLLLLFRVDCDEDTRCRLVYFGESRSAEWSEMASKSIANADKAILKWSFPFKKYLRVCKVLLSALYFLHAYLLVCSAIALRLSLPQLRSPPGLSPKDILADLQLRIRQLFNHRGMSDNIGDFFIEAFLCLAPLRCQCLSCLPIILSSYGMLLPVGSVLIAFFRP